MLTLDFNPFYVIQKQNCEIKKNRDFREQGGLILIEWRK